MKPLTLSMLESFYVGGERHVVSSPFFGTDEITFGAMYVQHMAPAEATFPCPVLFLHGGMHTGVTWETTPDGREGWQTLFVRGGFDTYVVDQPWRGRSAPDLRGLMPGLEPPVVQAPVYVSGRQLAKQFDRGGGRFAMNALDHYAAQLWPDFGVPKAVAAGHPGLCDPNALPPLCELLDRIGEVVLVTHSQGGHLGWQLALARPDLVRGIYAIEPAQTTAGLGDSAFPEIPVCVVWGDNLPETARTLSQVDLAEARSIAAVRALVEVDHLPESGIVGNGHMLMMEDNNAELATRSMDWFRRRLPG